MGIEVHLTNNFGDVAARIQAGAQAGVMAAAERLLALSAERVPLDQGTLQGSGTVDADPGDEPAAIVSYNTPYAARHHEHPEYNFQGGRQGKYVEEPALENAAELGEIIAAEVRRG